MALIRNNMATSKVAVDKYLGTSYDVIKTVYDNLAAINTAASILFLKGPTVASTTANITLSGEQTIDSVAVVTGDRVLVRSQTDNTENGIYRANSGAWTRTTDFDESSEVGNGWLVLDNNSGVMYATVVSGTWTPGTTAITFINIAGTVTNNETLLGSAFSTRVGTFTTLSYTPAANNLWVFRNGQKLDVGRDFTETSTGSITLTFDPNDGDQFDCFSNVSLTSRVTDAVNVTYTPAGTGAVPTDVQSKLRESGVTPEDFGAVGDGVTDDDAAVTLFFAALSAGYECRVPSGKHYLFNTPIVVTGKRRTLTCAADSSFRWNGVTAADAITFGDAGVTVTLQLEITNLRVLDGTAGSVMVDALVVLNGCNRSSFWGLKTAGANGLKTSGGAGLVFDSDGAGNGALSNSFFGYRSSSCNKAIRFRVGASANDNHFFGPQMEGVAAAKGEMAIDYPTGATSSTLNIYGGSIQAFQKGIVMGGVPGNWKIDGMYFESNDAGSIVETHASAVNLITVENCRFKGAVTTNAHIVSTASGKWKLSNNEFTDAPLIELNNANAKAVLADNYTATAETEVIETLGNEWIKISTDGPGNFELNQGTGVVQNNQYTLPQTQGGVEASVAGGGSTAVTFGTAWPGGSTIKVMATLNSSTSDGAVSVGSVTVAGFTLYNHNTTAKNIDWVAFRVA